MVDLPEWLFSTMHCIEWELGILEEIRTDHHYLIKRQWMVGLVKLLNAELNADADPKCFSKCSQEFVDKMTFVRDIFRNHLIIDQFWAAHESDPEIIKIRLREEWHLA